jgi:hypothetical protein
VKHNLDHSSSEANRGESQMSHLQSTTRALHYHTEVRGREGILHALRKAPQGSLTVQVFSVQLLLDEPIIHLDATDTLLLGKLIVTQLVKKFLAESEVYTSDSIRSSILWDIKSHT